MSVSFLLRVTIPQAALDEEYDTIEEMTRAEYLDELPESAREYASSWWTQAEVTIEAGI